MQPERKQQGTKRDRSELSTIGEKKGFPPSKRRDVRGVRIGNLKAGDLPEVIDEDNVYDPSMIEKKMFEDFTQARSLHNTAATSNAEIEKINNIANGPGVQQRIGKEITMKDIVINGFVNNSATNQDAGIARILLVYDTQPSGKVVGSQDILDPDLPTWNENVGVLAFKNKANRHRFYILRDEMFNVPPEGQQSATFRVNMKVNLKTVYYTDDFVNNNSDVDHRISSGALYLFGVATRGQTNNTIAMSFNSRIYYTDT